MGASAPAFGSRYRATSAAGGLASTDALLAPGGYSIGSSKGSLVHEHCRGLRLTLTRPPRVGKTSRCHTYMTPKVISGPMQREVIRVSLTVLFRAPLPLLVGRFLAGTMSEINRQGRCPDPAILR